MGTVSSRYERTGQYSRLLWRMRGLHRCRAGQFVTSITGHWINCTWADWLEWAAYAELVKLNFYKNFRYFGIQVEKN